LYVHTRGTLTKELARCLRTGRTLRRDQRRAVSRPGPIPDMVNRPGVSGDSLVCLPQLAAEGCC